MSKEKHRFYAPPESFSKDGVLLSEEESRHAMKVLRVQLGDRITVVDGAGGTFAVEIDAITKRRVSGRIVDRTAEEGESRSALHIALGILNQPARWETFLEKAVELGCTRVTPLVSERTQSSRIKMRRLQHIAISALKQSGRSRLPQLDEPTPFGQLIAEVDGPRIICHESSSDALRLADVSGEGEGLTALVGPEGGFSDEEVLKANNNGWKTVWLGQRRLRAETAAITVAAAISQLSEG